jgi:phytoene dehydrogenase-like protein
LAAGLELTRAGHQVTIFEASDGPGGRVRTDAVDGHRLDRGFQILLSAYPEAQSFLDYAALDLRSFSPGAMVRIGSGFHRVGDPLREPIKLIDTLRAPIGSPVDKAKIVAFRQAVRKGELADLWQRPETTALERLRSAGFSDNMIERFMRPLFSGITLDPELSGSSRVLEFVFRMLSAGNAAVPSSGMGAIADQMARNLPDGALRLSSPVRSVSANEVAIDDGETVAADHVIVATDMTEATRLANIEDRGWRGVTSVWFAADEPPIQEPVLVLNGTGGGPINSMAVMSQVSSAYAPPTASTIVVSAPTIAPGLADALQSQLVDWFGAAAKDWRTLRVDEIERAQPAHPVGHERSGAYQSADGVWICGDHARDASINGALGSGRAVATALIDAQKA